MSSKSSPTHGTPLPACLYPAFRPSGPSDPSVDLQAANDIELKEVESTSAYRAQSKENVCTSPKHGLGVVSGLRLVPLHRWSPSPGQTGASARPIFRAASSFDDPGSPISLEAEFRPRAYSSPSRVPRKLITEESEPETILLVRGRKLYYSTSIDSNATSEDESADLPTFTDWQEQLKRQVSSCMETASALAETPKPRLLWRVGKRQVSGPYDVKFLLDGRIAVAETWGRRVHVFNADGSHSHLLGEQLEPQTLAVMQDGAIAVSNSAEKDVVIISESGSRHWRPEGLARPQGIALKSDGGWAITDSEQHSLAIYNSEGNVLRHIGGLGKDLLNFSQPMYVTCDQHNRIVVADCDNHCVKVFDPTGERFLFRIGGYSSDGDGMLTFPYGVCVDRQNHLLVADYGNARVSEFSADGQFVRHVLTSGDVIRGPRALDYVTEGQYSARLVVTSGWLQRLWMHRIVQF